MDMCAEGHLKTEDKEEMRESKEECGQGKKRKKRTRE